MTEIKTIDLIQRTRRRLKADPWQICKIIFPDYNFKGFHKEWFEMERANEEDLCLGPRGFAKSTVRVVIFTIVCLIEDPNDSILITSDTGFQAVHFMSEIKTILESNMELRILYPHLAPGKKWTDSEITIRGMTQVRKEASVTALGYGGALTGLHFKKIIVDDIVDFENSRTEHQRKKLLEWLGLTLRPMLAPRGGQFHWNGTRYHPKDLYGIQLEAGFITNENSHRAIKESGIALWPEYFPVEALMKIRSKPEVGSLRFDAQYQNDTKLMSAGKLFKRIYFQYFNKTPQGHYITSTGKRFNIEDLQIFQTCDLATSKKTTADYFAILTFGIDKEGNFYIFDVYRARLSYAEQESFLINNFIKWKTLRIGIEATQYQIMLQQQVDRKTTVGARPLYPHLDKVTRSIPMQTKYENYKVFHFEKMAILSDFEDELTIFNEGDHDDMVDCVSMMPDITVSKKATIFVNR